MAGIIDTIGALSNPVGTILGGVASAFNYAADLRNQKAATEMAKYNTDATIQAQKDAANLAYQRNLEQWNRENQYNSPLANMQRLRAAGLNPMLVYGTGAVGANTAANSPQMPVINPEYKYQARQIPKMDPLAVAQTAQSLAMGKAQIDQVRANTELTLEEKKIRAVQALYEMGRDLKGEYKAVMGELVGRSMIAMAKGNLDTSSLASDLAFRQGQVETQKQDLISKMNTNSMFSLEKQLRQANLDQINLGMKATRQDMDIKRQHLPLDIALKRASQRLQEYEANYKQTGNQKLLEEINVLRDEINRRKHGADKAPWWYPWNVVYPKK